MLAHVAVLAATDTLAAMYNCCKCMMFSTSRSESRVIRLQNLMLFLQKFSMYLKSQHAIGPLDVWIRRSGFCVNWRQTLTSQLNNRAGLHAELPCSTSMWCRLWRHAYSHLCRIQGSNTIRTWEHDLDIISWYCWQRIDMHRADYPCLQNVGIKRARTQSWQDWTCHPFIRSKSMLGRPS